MVAPQKLPISLGFQDVEGKSVRIMPDFFCTGNENSETKSRLFCGFVSVDGRRVSAAWSALMWTGPDGVDYATMKGYAFGNECDAI